MPVDRRPKTTRSAWQKQLESAAAAWGDPKQIVKQGLEDVWGRRREGEGRQKKKKEKEAADSNWKQTSAAAVLFSNRAEFHFICLNLSNASISHSLPLPSVSALSSSPAEKKTSLNR